MNSYKECKLHKALVIGLSMGQQYASWLTSLGYSVSTVDVNPDKNPTYIRYEDAVLDNTYDIIYIGTPNWTHESIARHVAPYTRLLIVEKPGVVDSQAWKCLVEDFPLTRIMMVKNNQYRFEMAGYKQLAQLSDSVRVTWSRKSGIPGSSWFTQPELSFGGVSRDLMPHLLSYYTVLTDYNLGSKILTAIGDNNDTGIDDRYELVFNNNNTAWYLVADWKNNLADEHSIEFSINGNKVKFQLGDYMTAFGGCPAGPYMSMIKTAIDNLDNDVFWQEQKDQDIWIHEQIDI